MALFRKILIWMLVAAVGILVAEIIIPSQVLRTLCIFYAAPVAVVSNFIWLEPELGEKILEKRNGLRIEDFCSYMVRRLLSSILQAFMPAAATYDRFRHLLYRSASRIFSPSDVD